MNVFKEMNMSNTTNLEAAKKVKIAYEALDSKKAMDIKIIDIGGISVIADYFIIASGNNPAQVEALVDEVDVKLEAAGYVPKRVEGNKSSGWVLMDYQDIVVHIFSKEDRLFYTLEKVWENGTVIEDVNSL
jgi:ribosome-associated protein